MTDHLPECIFKPENVDSAKGIRWGGRPCICDELRACEQRIGNVISASLVGGYDWRHGYLAGLDAAREAVADMVIKTAGNSAATVDQALAAIDALREKP